MKTKLIFLSILFLGIINLKAQQCDPVVTSPRLGAMFPDKVVFCNTESETLSTTQTYGSYQWYKQEWDWQTPNPNPWVPVSGATSQSLTINGTADMLYYFKVEVTEGDCVAESTPILADGYAYGLPFMMADFTPGTFEEVNGEYNVCNGASVQLSNGYPQVYGVHTWFRCVPSNIPASPSDPCIIAGETGDSYTATDSGHYGFYACTEYCPDQCEFLGDFAFIKLNFGNWNFCETLGTGEVKPKENSLSIYPNPASQFLYIGREADKKYAEVSIIDMSGKLIQQKKDHQYNEPINVSSLIPGTYLVVSKTKDGKLYRNKFIKK
ncbi:Por secretion system C-terminal sorting domain-containing protein [Chryseobacterium arachidis]|uniref:Por secretion system C-terminal sorting domain-containing protein n=1 Tax=Chryseobacterium arachidis TaxID=1416778 RepID=A0A1M5J9U0_9FLAO|nr:T9SS type A sorting domain-containing protein [Chryseobacterium arachidis]SHG37334.1 Por secretion system C-terminal sorting domain-containing protein [Chryseobacterium arachidis]